MYSTTIREKNKNKNIFPLPKPDDTKLCIFQGNIDIMNIDNTLQNQKSFFFAKIPLDNQMSRWLSIQERYDTVSSLSVNKSSIYHQITSTRLDIIGWTIDIEKFFRGWFLRWLVYVSY